jgi:hypothetical protein
MVNTFQFTRSARPSALARIYPTLLAKGGPPPRRSGGVCGSGQTVVFAVGQVPCGASSLVCRQRSPGMPSCKGSLLRASGADDGNATRTPSAWMISLLSWFALRQIVFSVWATLNEQKWATLGERRRPGLAWCTRVNGGSAEKPILFLPFSALSLLSPRLLRNKNIDCWKQRGYTYVFWSRKWHGRRHCFLPHQTGARPSQDAPR